MGITEGEPLGGTAESPFEGAEDYITGGESPPAQHEMPGRVFLSYLRDRSRPVVDAAAEARAATTAFFTDSPQGRRIAEHLEKTKRTWEATPKGTKIAITVFTVAAAAAAKRLHNRRSGK